jgi:hypothetical protein
MDCDTEKTPRLPDRSHASRYGLSQEENSENNDLALSQTPNLKEPGVPVEEPAHIDDEDAASFADDDSSVPSDDFYSIISHEVRVLPLMLLWTGSYFIFMTRIQSRHYTLVS